MMTEIILIDARQKLGFLMIPSPTFCQFNLIKISIPILLSLMIIFLFSSILLVKAAMKVHPTKRNLAIRDGEHFNSSSVMESVAHKKLRRLPHVFSKVLELPFRSDADVLVEESSDCFRFVVEIDKDDIVGGDGGNGIRAHAVEIHPGVTKIVIRKGGGGSEVAELMLDQLKIDTWRFRLPESARPELAAAVFVDGELIVTVPTRRDGFEGDRGIWGGLGRVVFVQ